ncbi:MAG TPA: choice-of-anchor tandem repeat GloVer-containing protein, partial [Candidatus Acidoferrum sp.]|nr:choice-of-anchor tandem repeat GloVer-containing protein [Candidatus Acidoferrum sp.]
SPLLDVDGVLYGTTYQGGKYNRGTVFAVTTRGRQHVVYSFVTNGYDDGQYPMGGLAYLEGRMYGTTENGGHGSGTIYSVTTNGTEKELHSFVGSDGSQPMAGLIAVKNILYGTTFVGGAKNVGSIFSVTPAGSETVLHSFSDGTGKNPMARLLVADHILYGTTHGGYYAHHGGVFSFIP